eukprot:gene186-345_t
MEGAQECLQVSTLDKSYKVMVNPDAQVWELKQLLAKEQGYQYDCQPGIESASGSNAACLCSVRKDALLEYGRSDALRLPLDVFKLSDVGAMEEGHELDKWKGYVKGEKQTCVICHGIFGVDDPPIRDHIQKFLPNGECIALGVCGHVFHESCILSHINSKGAMQCPVCNDPWHYVNNSADLVQTEDGPELVNNSVSENKSGDNEKISIVVPKADGTSEIVEHYITESDTVGSVKKELLSRIDREAEHYKYVLSGSGGVLFDTDAIYGLQMHPPLFAVCGTSDHDCTKSVSYTATGEAPVDEGGIEVTKGEHTFKSTQTSGLDIRKHIARQCGLQHAKIALYTEDGAPVSDSISLDEIRIVSKQPVGATVNISFVVLTSFNWEVDFWTERSFLPSPNSLLIRDILDFPQSEDSVLYVSYRRTHELPMMDSNPQARVRGGTRMFSSSIEFSRPWGCDDDVAQSIAGQSELLSCLFVLTKLHGMQVSQMTGFLRRLVGYGPSAHVLHLYLSKKTVSAPEAGLLSATIYRAVRKLFPQAPAGRIFENARAFLNLLKKDSESGDAEGEDWETLDLLCPITRTRIVKAGCFRGENSSDEIVNFDECAKLNKNDRKISGKGTLMQDVQMTRLIRDRVGDRGPSLEILAEPKAIDPDYEPDYEWLGAQVTRYQLDRSKLDKLLQPAHPDRVHQERIPCLLIDDNKLLSVVSQTTSGAPKVFNPVARMEKDIDLGALSASAVANVEDETEELKEVIFVLLDCSQSMDDTSGFLKSQDPTTERAEKILDSGWTDQIVQGSAQHKKMLVQEELTSLRASAWFPFVQSAIYKKGGQKQVRRGLAAMAMEGYCHFIRDNPREEQSRKIISEFRDKFIEALCAVPKKTTDWRSYLPKADEPDSATDGRDVPHEFICPIGYSIMCDPVVASDGFSYDREQITPWLDSCGGVARSPLTGAVLVSKTINPNFHLKKRIEDWQKQGKQAKRDEGQPPAKRRRGKNADQDLDEFPDSMLPQEDPKIVVNVHIDCGIQKVLAQMDEPFYSIRLRAWSLMPDRDRANFKLCKVSMSHGENVNIGDGWYSYQGAYPDQTPAHVSGSINYETTLPSLKMKMWENEAGSASMHLTRMQAVKHIFSAFTTRSQAYRNPVGMGLITFDTFAKVKQPITTVFAHFQRQIDRCDSGGDTALFDALDMACDQFILWKSAAGKKDQRKKTKCRCLVLSDGADSCSTNSSWIVAKKLQQQNVIVDSVCIGSCSFAFEDLNKVSKSTGGYCFHPKQLRHALSTVELETVLMSTERPTTVVRPINTFADWSNYYAPQTDVVNDHEAPARKQPEQMAFKSQRSSSIVALDLDEVNDMAAERPTKKGDFVRSSGLSSAELNGKVGRVVGFKGSRAVVDFGGNHGTKDLLPKNLDLASSQSRKRRIMAEIKKIHESPHPHFDVYPTDRDIGFWKVVMAGPDACPYAGGVWLLWINFPEEYPEIPPEVRFQTKIKHVNINAHGKVCHPLLTNNEWTRDVSMRQIFETIISVLMHPVQETPLDSNLTLEMHNDNGEYEVSIANFVTRYAKERTRAQWEEFLIKEDGDGDIEI